jgi:putative peptidoglycan lipid II flippase
MLIAAYYARKNTVIPTLVGLASIACYAAVALTTYQTIGLPGMAFANAVQNSSHAVILFVLLTLTIGNLGMRELGEGTLRIAAAAVGMAAAGVGTQMALSSLKPHTFTVSTTSGSLLLLVIAGGAACAVYVALAWLLRIPELGLLAETLRRRVGRA